ncbi:hypothetical protein HGRIS_004142 [Hohenbuehelia grisea]|uniref:F-box protein n=1 Tax=Hohenbuehelia grisea TaxID=104357 RepID=A0ABR3JIL3_9AGAR
MRRRDRGCNAPRFFLAAQVIRVTHAHSRANRFPHSKILSQSDRGARAAFRRASRRFSDIGTLSLYYNPTAKPLPLSWIFKLFRTLTRSESAAAAVRTLSLDLMLVQKSIQLKASHDLICKAMKSLPLLTTLKLHFVDGLPGRESQLLRDCHFPRLQGLAISYPSQEQNAALYRFLSRHPTISTLNIHRCHNPSSFDLSEEYHSTLVMPSLVDFDGDPDWLAAIVPNGKLEGLGVRRWRGHDDVLPSSPGVFEMIANHARTSKESIKIFKAFSFSWDTRLVSLCGECSGLATLMITVNNDHTLDCQDFMRTFEREVLPSMKRLISIYIFQHSFESSSPSKLEELRTICRWEAVCPTLCAIKISSA